MTAKEFVAWVQRYYGPYPDGQKTDIWEYITKLSPTYLDTLKAVLVKRCSSEFRKVPDVAVFERLADEVLTLMPGPPAIEAPRNEEEYQSMAELTAEARERGIDPTVEGWMAQLLMARVREGKNKMASRGVK